MSVDASRTFALLVALGVAACGASGQCLTAWSNLGVGLGANGGLVFAVEALANGDVVIGGMFQAAGGSPAANIARWDGSQWFPLGRGLGIVADMKSTPSEDVVAGGSFVLGGTAFNHVARWDGSSWTSLGAGVSGCVGCGVDAVLVLPNGDVVVGGSFVTAGGVSANRIARWNGSNWLPLGSGLNDQVLALARMPNGDLIASGAFSTAGGSNASRIARWNGSAWSPLGAGIGPWFAASLLVMPDGRLVAGGNFTSAGGVAANHVAVWDGQSWSPLGSGLNDQARALLCLPNGDLLVGGYFTAAGGIPAQRLARWDGANWSAVGSGVGGGGITSIQAMQLSAAGEVIVVGDFTTAGGVAAAQVARLQTSCPSMVLPYGAGCSGSAGTATLTGTTLPWRGTTFRAHTAGLPAIARAAGVFGFSQTNVPLSSGHALGLPGCSVLVSDEIVIEFLVGNGAVDSSIDIPNAPSLVGASFYHQVVSAELDAAGALVALTSSNALAVTIGSF